MTRPHLRALVPLAALAVLAGACETKKSANPLSPTIAGPIPGVEITQPILLEPGQGWKFKDTQQPITLLIENASTNGVRPLVYAFEIAVDAAFRNVVFSRRDVAQGDNGRTALRLPDKLELGRTYYWRAWAYDGANTGAIASSVSFEVYPPAVLNPPAPVAPAAGSTVTAAQPELVVRNSGRSGPIGNVSYFYQVATDQAFSQVVADTASARQPENVGAGQTSWRTNRALAASTTFYWRVYASDGETASSWSSVSTFSTSAPAPAPSPGPGIPPGGSCASLASNPENVVACRRAQYGARISPGEAPGLLRSIAQDLNAGTNSSYYGLLVKTSGNNCSGFSCDIICGRDGNLWDVLADGPDATQGYAGTAQPVWFFKGTTTAACDVR